ncbi:MAG: LssY C-terminal domain-containing protein [Bryobacteraceae bacterium]
MLRHCATLLASIAVLFLFPCSICAGILPAGTRVEARLSTPTGSRISHPGDPIEATVIAPVLADGRLVIPQGATVSGVVQRVKRLGLGLKHLTSGIEYRFDRVQLADGTSIPVQARVVQVETAKERVNEQGIVGGIYPTANLSATAAFYVLPLLYLDPEFGVPLLGVKSLIARSPDPEIYFPAGTEVILQLTAEADIHSPSVPQNDIAPLSAAEMADVNRVLAKLPQQRTDRGRNHPSDLINILFLGSRESLNRAFQAAGWSGAHRSSLRSIYRLYHCMVQRMGYSMAPMGKLRLNGVTADVEYQKGLNTFSKRHHVRLWKQGQEDAWLSAATEDVGYKLRRMHLTHATDPLIDNERAKVLNDLAFTGCLDAATLMTRDSSGGGDQQELSIKTDRRVAVLRMNECQNPRTTAIESTKNGLRGRRRSVQILIALRNDLIRINPLSLASSTVRALQHHQSSNVNGSMSAFSSQKQKTNSSESSIQPAWIRPSVLDARSVTNDSQR